MTTMHFEIPKHFWKHVDRTQGDKGCWVWIDGRDKGGYGKVGFRNRNWRAHRLIYIAINGPLPAGYEIDHLCRNTSCVNPLHLKAVTHRENGIRGEGPAGLHFRQNACKRGHPFDDANTYRDRLGNRHCRACQNIHHREYWARKKVVLDA